MSSTGDDTHLETSLSLLARARSHDDPAWERIVELYAPLVYYWCRQYRLQDEDVADVFQEVFRSVALNLDRFRKRGSSGTFRGWLRTITRNKVHDLLRGREREAPGKGGTLGQIELANLVSPEASEPELEPCEPDRTGTHLLLHRALERIRPSFREQTWRAFWETAIDGRVPVDVAHDLQTTPGAVRVAKCRVLKRLREELGDSPPESPPPSP